MLKKNFVKHTNLFIQHLVISTIACSTIGTDLQIVLSIKYNIKQIPFLTYLTLNHEFDYIVK